MSLSDQCSALAISIDKLELRRSGNQWQFGNSSFDRPEAAALAYYQNEGFLGACCEGGPILLTLKAAGLDWLVKNNTFQDRNDAINRYLEAAIQISKDKRTGFVDHVARVRSGDFDRNFRELYASDFIRSNYPEISIRFIRELRKVLGQSLVRIAEIFVEDPYRYRAGWPDLTLVRPNQLFARGEIRFVEIKTTDKLHDSQAVTITEIIKKVGLNVSVTKLVSKNSV